MKPSSCGQTCLNPTFDCYMLLEHWEDAYKEAKGIWLDRLKVTFFPEDRSQFPAPTPFGACGPYGSEAARPRRHVPLDHSPSSSMSQAVWSDQEEPGPTSHVIHIACRPEACPSISPPEATLGIEWQPQGSYPDCIIQGKRQRSYGRVRRRGRMAKVDLDGRKMPDTGVLRCHILRQPGESAAGTTYKIT
ncbi:hypothetical protein SAY87_005307 [Trapa incisa]|uniref:Uncharacterized protein n=1 Tax=Trapa incisa TaxID=236973 RepID=A0AAN7Q7E2_9MYRT|nr:hypothetical protein SAY87_005307 [Trapa incisa]